MIGRVVSVKMQKTAVVLIERRKTHPLYKKSYLRSKKYLVDDEIGVKLGDVVEIEKIRPISKRKHWKIVKVLGTDIVSLGKEALKEGASEAIAEVLPEEVESSDVSLQSSDEKQESEKLKKEVNLKEKPKKARVKKEVKSDS